MNTIPKPRLRWYQYRLRSLLVLMVLVAIGGSWFTVKKQQVERQRAAVKAIEALGSQTGAVARVVYDFQGDDDIFGPIPIPMAQPPGPAWLRALLGEDFFAHVISVYFDGAITDAELEHIKSLPQLQRLRLTRTQVTDAGLECLQGLTQLHELSLRNTAVTGAGLGHLKRLRRLHVLKLGGTQVADAGLVHLIGLAQLRELSLSDTEITDAGLRDLSGLAQLQTLRLNSTQVTDAGLSHLVALAQLQELSLSDTTISDAGLECLKGLTQLQKLDLYRTKVTFGGVKRLQQALPNCRIYSDVSVPSQLLLSDKNV